jgi:hypothetical protein
MARPWPESDKARIQSKAAVKIRGFVIVPLHVENTPVDVP